MSNVRPRLALLAVTLLAILVASGLGWRAWREPGAEALFRQARSDLAAGRPGLASAAVRRLERLRPPTPFDRLLRAQVAEALGRPDDAVSELARVADAHPLAPVARLLTGQIERKRDRLRAAEAAFLATAALEPATANPRRELVYIYNVQHRQADLDAQLHALSELGSLEFEYLLHWGKTRNIVWNPERDCEALAKCLEADPADRRSRLALAEGLRLMNRLDQAKKILEPLADAEANAARARVALDLNDTAEFDRLLAAAPDDEPFLARIRGQLALARHDDQAAIRYLRIAHANDPHDRAVLFGLGSALRRAGRGPEAEPYLAAALRHDALTPLLSKASSASGRDDPATPARLGAACEAAGRVLEARAWYRLAISRDPLNNASQAAFSRLGRQIAGRH